MYAINIVQMFDVLSTTSLYARTIGLFRTSSKFGIDV